MDLEWDNEAICNNIAEGVVQAVVSLAVVTVEAAMVVAAAATVAEMVAVPAAEAVAPAARWLAERADTTGQGASMVPMRSRKGKDGPSTPAMRSAFSLAGSTGASGMGERRLASAAS